MSQKLQIQKAEIYNWEMNKSFSQSQSKCRKPRLAHHKTCRICPVIRALKLFFLILKIKHFISTNQNHLHPTQIKVLNGLFIVSYELWYSDKILDSMDIVSVAVVTSFWRWCDMRWLIIKNITWSISSTFVNCIETYRYFTPFV